MTTKAQLSKLGLFDANAPRYTSYPTAPQFGNGVNPEVFQRWIEEIPPGSEISLYLHIPFCRHLCWFCACRTQGTSNARPVLSYLETLQAELKLLKTHLPQGVRLSRLHWGGGTPTLLEPKMIIDLAASIQEVTPLAENAEFSVEIDPKEIDAARLDALQKAGMNRASIGVQDFDPEIQKMIGREQSFEITQDAVNGLRDCGIHSLNTDILYGLPSQTPQKITDSVQKLLSLSPDRVALYGYAHVPWTAKRQLLIPEDKLPDPEERLALFDVAKELFFWDGYTQIGIDHFATKTDGLAVARDQGTLHRNFQGYTDDPSPVLIGLGASSISRFPQGYAQNAAATHAYTAAIRAGQFSTARGHAFVGDDLMRGRMIEMLMCYFHIDKAEILENFDIQESELNSMLESVNAHFDNLLKLNSFGLTIPDAMQPMTRMIAFQLDAYSIDKAIHSLAI